MAKDLGLSRELLHNTFHELSKITLKIIDFKIII